MPPAKDPELEALPAPRRPWRVATLFSLATLSAASVYVGVGLLPQAEFALMSGQPTEMGNLSTLQPKSRHQNAWVHGTGNLSTNAVGYRRPLDEDRFRLAPIEGNPRLWVELREPEGTRGEYFIAPSSFVGRLVAVDHTGLRHSGLVHALRSSGQPFPPPDAWLLLDGEAPRTSRWALGVIGLLLAFVGFAAWGIHTLLRPAKSTKIAQTAT